MTKDELHRLMKLLSDKEQHKDILKKLHNDAQIIYEGFATEGLVTIYEMCSDECKDKLVSILLETIKQ